MVDGLVGSGCLCAGPKRSNYDVFCSADDSLENGFGYEHIFEATAATTHPPACELHCLLFHYSCMLTLDYMKKSSV